jgi:GTP-binding protein
VSDAGHRLKFFYATQLKQAPPMFLLFVNRDELFSDSYSTYLARELRRAFGYEGCPIILIARRAPRTIEPKRKFKNARGGNRVDRWLAKASQRPTEVDFTC